MYIYITCCGGSNDRSRSILHADTITLSLSLSVCAISDYSDGPRLSIRETMEFSSLMRAVDSYAIPRYIARGISRGGGGRMIGNNNHGVLLVNIKR